MIKRLEDYITSSSQAIFVVESSDQLVGYGFVGTETYERTRHEAIVYLGVKTVPKRWRRTNFN